MKSINIGIVNLVVSKKLKDAYFSNTLIEESKELTNDFFAVVKNSPILQLEFKVFNNIENKHIDNDLVATRYIDNNIKLFEVWTLKEIEKEHQKLKPFLTEDVQVDDNRVQLYIAIGNLIKESLSNYDKIDVDNIHESFTLVLEHVKNNKQSLTESIEVSDLVNEDVIEIAVDKFNTKYESLTEDDRTLLQKLIKSDDNEKANLLETYKIDNLNILENVNENDAIAKERIASAIKKLKEMKFNPQTVDNDIIGLYELKKELL
ncbi:MAG: hypothetical protein WC428_00960 [Candidatus Paceibacterota bacterium]|jgi:hypothetical protein